MEVNVVGAAPDATPRPERARRDHNIWVMPTARILEILGGTFKDAPARRPARAGVEAPAPAVARAVRR